MARLRIVWLCCQVTQAPTNGPYAGDTEAREAEPLAPVSEPNPAADQDANPAILRVMTAPSTTPDATGQTEIEASPEAVYAFLSDPARMSEIAEELVKVVRRDATAGQVGSRFVGFNRNGKRLWPTLGKVTDAESGRRFAFEVEAVPGLPVARWQYDIEPTESGCRVTESTWDRRAKWLVPATTPLTGVADRVTVNTRNIEATLGRLKAKIEAGVKG